MNEELRSGELLEDCAAEGDETLKTDRRAGRDQGKGAGRGGGGWIGNNHMEGHLTPYVMSFWGISAAAVPRGNYPWDDF